MSQDSGVPAPTVAAGSAPPTLSLPLYHLHLEQHFESARAELPLSL